MFWFLLGVVIAVLGGLALVALVRVALAIVAWVLQLVFALFSDNNY